ncbi:MAG: hypothetical protein ACD_79C00499G0001 [uncultured bacterium]|nr:MAG: hypothetical protein ACD_79C00499G0001 [uncultured bacterium]
MNLTFIRHGDAVKLAKSDEERTLTDKGKEDIKKIGLFLKKAFERYDVIISSPYIRALETANIIADILGMQNNVITDPRLGCGSNFFKIKDVVNENKNFKNILFSGHAPDMGIITAELLGTANQIDFHKGSIMKVELNFFRTNDANLRFFISPEQI